VRTLLDRIAALEAKLSRVEQQLAERDARIAELEGELRQRRKGYRPKPNAARAAKGRHDRRRRRYRQHRGVFRPPPVPDEHTIHHDVHVEQCPHCGSHDLEATGKYDDHLVQDIPEPRLELHRYRRHEYRCVHCQKPSQGRGDLELPGAHIGPRARLLVGYSRAYLGISLEKTCTLLQDLFGLRVSRAGALGHIRWSGQLCAPVVKQLLQLLRQEPLVQADET
jgi:DNA-directed RNA polymerase subunit RPC12/RpoP